MICEVSGDVVHKYMKERSRETSGKRGKKVKKKRGIFFGVCLLICLNVWVQSALAVDEQTNDQGGQVRSEGRIGFAEKGSEKPIIKPKPKPWLPQTGEISSDNELFVGLLISGIAILLFVSKRKVREEEKL